MLALAGLFSCDWRLGFVSLYCVLYYTVLCCTVLYCTVLYNWASFADMKIDRYCVATIVFPPLQGSLGN